MLANVYWKITIALHQFYPHIQNKYEASQNKHHFYQWLYYVQFLLRVWSGNFHPLTKAARCSLRPSTTQWMRSTSCQLWEPLSLPLSKWLTPRSKSLPESCTTLLCTLSQQTALRMTPPLRTANSWPQRYDIYSFFYPIFFFNMILVATERWNLRKLAGYLCGFFSLVLWVELATLKTAQSVCQLLNERIDCNMTYSLPFRLS